MMLVKIIGPSGEKCVDAINIELSFRNRPTQNGRFCCLTIEAADGGHDIIADGVVEIHHPNGSLMYTIDLDGVRKEFEVSRIAA